MGLATSLRHRARIKRTIRSGERAVGRSSHDPVMNEAALCWRCHGPT